MTPNRRLDQLEPLMADSLQKIDRLIEGQGKLVELATDTKAELDQVKKLGDLTANGLANLTVSSQKQFEELKAGLEGIITGQDELKTVQDQLITGQDELRTVQDQLITGQNELKTVQDQLITGQDELRAVQNQLKAGQDAIMHYLREKLP